MILNVEPGGCGADTARPASPSTAPSLGRITATPPSRLPSAFAAARWSPGWIVVWTERPAWRGSLTIVRWPKRSARLGCAGDRRPEGVGVQQRAAGRVDQPARRLRPAHALDRLAAAQAGEPQRRI